jgi:hypothetical protein
LIYRLQTDFLNVTKKKLDTYKRKDSFLKLQTSKRRVNLSMRVERSKSIKYYGDIEYSNWQHDLNSKHKKDLKRLENKKRNLETKALVLKEVDKLKHT